MLDLLISLFRSFRGERRGMGSQLRAPTPEQEARIASLYPRSFSATSILIQNQVLLADVSFWQGVIDFVKMKSAGVFGVFIRAGQRNWDDIKFKINWKLAKLAGIPRGSYWFYDSREDPRKQAERWWALLDGDTGELPHAADFEESYGGPFGKKSDFKAFLLRFEELSRLPKERIIIYTGYFWWLERIGGDIFFSRYRLWLASYGSMVQARIPPPWTERDLLFWQYTASGDGLAYGAGSRELDLNWFCCDVAAFFKQFPLIGGEVPPPPPPPTQGDPMEGKVFRFTNMRLDKNQNSADLGDFLAGDVVTYTMKEPGSDGLVWCYVIDATRNGSPIKRKDGRTVAQAPVWAWADNIVALAPPPVPVEDEPVEVIMKMKSGKVFVARNFVQQ